MGFVYVEALGFGAGNPDVSYGIHVGIGTILVQSVDLSFSFVWFHPWISPPSIASFERPYCFSLLAFGATT